MPEVSETDGGVSGRYADGRLEVVQRPRLRPSRDEAAGRDEADDERKHQPRVPSPVAPVAHWRNVSPPPEPILNAA